MFLLENKHLNKFSKFLNKSNRVKKKWSKSKLSRKNEIIHKEALQVYLNNPYVRQQENGKIMFSKFIWWNSPQQLKKKATNIQKNNGKSQSHVE